MFNKPVSTFSGPSLFGKPVPAASLDTGPSQTQAGQTGPPQSGLSLFGKPAPSLDTGPPQTQTGQSRLLFGKPSLDTGPQSGPPSISQTGTLFGKSSVDKGPQSSAGLFGKTSSETPFENPSSETFGTRLFGTVPSPQKNSPPNIKSGIHF